MNFTKNKYKNIKCRKMKKTYNYILQNYGLIYSNKIISFLSKLIEIKNEIEKLELSKEKRN